MLLDDDVVAQRPAEPGTFAGRLGGEERIENLRLDVGRNASAVVANLDLHAIAQIPGRSGERRFEVRIAALSLALGARVKAIRDQIQQHSVEFLRIEIDLAYAGIEIFHEGDVEARLLGAGAVISEIEALLEQRVEVDRPVLAGTLARMQQHVLDDRVGAFAMLNDFLEIALDQPRQLVDFLLELLVGLGLGDQLLELVQQLPRHSGEIVDEVQRILDFVRDARRQLPEGSEFLRLDYILAGPARFADFRSSAPAPSCASAPRRTSERSRSRSRLGRRS